MTEIMKRAADDLRKGVAAEKDAFTSAVPRAISLYLAAKYSLANSQIFSLFSVGLKSGCSSLLYS